MDVLSAMEVFVRVIKLQSFSLAASDLGVSSSSVSKQVSHLEKHVGAALLERTTRRLSVTEAGAAYYEKCQLILSQVEQAETLVTELQGTPCGLLKVNSDIAFGSLLLAKAIPVFMERYPDIQLDLVLDDGAAGIVKEGVDLAFRIADSILPDEDLNIKELATIPQVLCATPEYLALHGEPRTPEELKEHKCLLSTSSKEANRWALSNSEGTYVVQAKGGLRANSSLVSIGAMQAHQGISKLARFEADRFIEEGSVRILLPDYDVSADRLFVAFPERQYKNYKAGLLIAFIEEWLVESLQQEDVV
ncbi:LysR family transcriptional regulator [Amphritea sp.]|uniref:LysR family transcriptional regulator n=1 Tax=Amphritea sp. TaxID=1872502 RepID=UPI0025BC9D5B|nr:LysR family transcriptional regulator [Amphritea sp.]